MNRIGIVFPVSGNSSPYLFRSCSVSTVLPFSMDIDVDPDMADRGTSHCYAAFG
jgi:hypothetical protein